MTILTDNEAKALIYFAVGVSSESLDKAYELSLAGNISHDGRGNVLLHPVGASGYSLGTLQNDLGQSDGTVATELTDAFQAWALVHQPGWVLTPADRTKTINDLSRNGHQITERDHGRDLDATVKSHMNTFLTSEEGVAFVHGRDVEQVDKLMVHVVEPLRATPLFQHASADDQARMVAIGAKAYNQSKRWGRRLVEHVVDGSYRSVADMSDAIDQLPDYMQTGRNDALRGTDLFIAMQRTSSVNAMRAPWQDVVANPLVNPARLAGDTAHPNLVHSYPAIKDMFVDPIHGRQMIQALEAGGSYAKTSNGRGFYAEGSDFAEWGKNGQGRAFAGGRWMEFSASDVSTVVNIDHTLDLRLNRNGAEEQLLHILHPAAASRDRPRASLHATARHASRRGTLSENDHGRDVRDLQAQLSLLGLRGVGGHALVLDGAFGRDTVAAVEAFQRDHGLAVDGVAGDKTLDALKHAAQPGPAASSVADASHPGHNMFRQALDGVHRLDAQHGRSPDEHSQNLAAALAVAARSEGMSRIDHVLLTDDANRAYAVQGNMSSPLKRYADVGVIRAMNTPVAESSLQWNGEMVPLASAAAPIQPTQTVQPQQEASH